MKDLKAIQTPYNGYLFRSRLEARWAVFFDACGVEYEYEPEGYDLGNGLMYLPDFLLHGVDGRSGGDLYVEVKGKMNDSDAEKIKRFAALGRENTDRCQKSKTAILVVGKIPDGTSIDDITWYISRKAYDGHPRWPNEFNFETIDGDYFGAHPGVNHDGKFELFGDDSSYLEDMNPIRTEKAYRLARCARFEHGEVPRFKGGKINA
jgi:hypothetical protein